MSILPGRRSLASVRRRRTLFLVTAILLPLLLFGLPRVVASEASRQLILLGWCALYAVATLLCVFARCPRCGHLFHSTYPTDNPFAPRCRGCGLSTRASVEELSSSA